MKKRILSLILALSMVLSVFPLGAFAEGPLPELVMENGYPVGSNGNGWSYDNNTQTLTLTSGPFDFSSTHPQNTGAGTRPVPAVRCMIEIRSGVEITGSSFGNSVTNYGTISSGTFQTMGGGVINEGTIKNGTFTDSVTNNKTISGGTFQNGCSVTNGGTISDGTFQNRCIVTNKSIISGGTFQNGCSVTNNKTISGGTFQNGCSVTNYHTIKDNGTFEGTVTNNGTIENGTFKGNVTNKTNGLIYGGTFQNKCSVTNYGTITGNGTFNGTVTNDYYIKNGTFKGDVTNKTNGIIYGGTFAGSVTNSGTVNSGVFKGKNNLTNVYAITWDTAYPNAKIEKVNDVSVDWPPYVCAGTTVTITADTEIFSLNGKLLGEGDHVNGNKNTVTFTMPNEDVVLNKAITCTDLVMEKGWPKASNGGKNPCKGNGWEYKNGTLYLYDGMYDFSTIGDGSAVECKIEISSMATITGGTFTGTVTNSGTINDGTFNGAVKNNRGINSGTFNETVTNEGTITGGVFKGVVENDGQGKIVGGTFTGSVNNKNNRIYGGVFNGKTGLDSVTGVHSITVASGAKITEVNGVPAAGVSAVWDPYVVVTASTMNQEVTITASTEIYSLNGQPIVDGNCNSSYPDTSKKTTVKFTMPDDNVVLGTGDLVMAGGYPVGSNNGTADCEGNGWEYAAKDMRNPTGKLTLTSGTYDFDLANPRSTTDKTPADAPVACAIEIQSGVEITGGTFEKKVTNNVGGTISGGTFQETCSVTNNGTIKNGTFKDVCSVTNEGANATIENGTFKNMCRVINNSNGTISGGTFKNKCRVENNAGGTISDGTFAGSVSNNGGTVNGGIFNGNTGLDGVTNLHSITVASGAKIEKVNGVSADWAPYVVTSNATTKEVTITADTEIFSLNGQPIAESSYGVDKKTVTFTMPDDDVVLNKAITSTDLVMENGWPKDSDGGKNPCKGDGWQYIPNDPNFGNVLLLTGSNQTGGLYDFSTIGDGSAVECNVFVGKPTAITGGEFNGKVFNNSGILGGTFHGEVDNMGPGRIVNGTFKNSVENNGMIENGTFHDKVKNNGTIEKGTFEGTVENNTNGTISGGTFAGSVSNNGGTVNGGIFNGNTGLDGVTDLHSITWDAAYPNAKIEKVNDVSANWVPYVVTSNATTKEVTITADTEIFSLNGQPIAESSYGVDKKTVTFTMPDDDVVLNGELITKPEPEPEPEPKPEPQPEPEPEPTTYTVTVIGGTIDGKTSVSAKENDTLTVVLDQNDIPDGMTFDLWSISSDKLSGDINVDYRAEAMTFQMPAEDVTIRAQYRSAEIIEDAAPSPLATAATIAVGGAAAGIVVWQGVNLGVDLYLANALPQGVPVPTDRRALALLLWETAGKPEVALPTLYGDIPAEEIELQKATRWAVQNGLMDAADKKDASFFDPDHYVTKMDVFGAWLRLKKLLGTT